MLNGFELRFECSAMPFEGRSSKALLKFFLHISTKLGWIKQIICLSICEMLQESVVEKQIGKMMQNICIVGHLSRASATKEQSNTGRKGRTSHERLERYQLLSVITPASNSKWIIRFTRGSSKNGQRFMDTWPSCLWKCIYLFIQRKMYAPADCGTLSVHKALSFEVKLLFHGDGHSLHALRKANRNLRDDMKALVLAQYCYYYNYYKR